jgi:hypothetical protein
LWVRGCVVVWLSGGRGRAWPMEGGQRQGRAWRTTRTTRTEAAVRARQAAGRDDIRRAGRVGDGLYVCVVGQIRGHGDGELGWSVRVALAVAACGSRVAAGGLWALGTSV